ncbi:DUF4423 domain-containing protein [Synechococcus sp. EJ6-Ellesmere]|uniref:DUF4423 domain-containing protein n=1 Tax=Synechococcus sp. EJ6-Ellesmere TaxID=2823734 RepID=UPI0020CCDEF4|nr:DUF4423 domain-containing protein [Synechococcus sp. EJ6-Ellesmere]
MPRLPEKKGKRWIPDRIDGRALADFSLIHAAGAAAAGDALQAGLINLSDLGLVLLLVQHIRFPGADPAGLLDPRHPALPPREPELVPVPIGRAAVSIEALAEATGQAVGEVEQSIERLKQAGLLVHGQDKAVEFLLISPTVVTTGGFQARNRIWREFLDLSPVGAVGAPPAGPADAPAHGTDAAAAAAA